MKLKYILGISLLMSSGLLLTSCSDENDYSINTAPIISSVTAGSPAVSAASATIAGSEVKSLAGQSASAYTVGIVYSKSAADVANGVKVAGALNADGTTFDVLLEGLETNTAYYYMAYVTLQGKITKYSAEVKSFVTSNAKVSTVSATGVTAVAATLGGQLADVGNVPASAKLVCGVLMSVSKDDASMMQGLNLSMQGLTPEQTASPYSFTKTALVPGTKYYYKAYMKLNDGYFFGQLDSVTTQSYEAEFVDLGLDVLWAKTNVGAMSETQAGGLYGYGDASGLKLSTDISDYARHDIVGSAYDICSASGSGRLPTAAEMRQLINRCKITEETKEGVAGYTVTGPNGNSIFIPQAGFRTGETVTEGGASLMTGTISDADNAYGYIASIGSAGAKFATASIANGLSARAVLKNKADYDNSKFVICANAGDLRLEVYNAWGATAGNPGINKDGFLFTKNMYVNFTLFGLGKLDTPVTAVIGFASGDWGLQDWATSVEITGDGTYTIPVTGSATGITVFVIDIKGQEDKLGLWQGYINSIILDSDNTADYYAWNGEKINASSMIYGDLENKGNYRVEIFNQYGSTAGMAESAFASLKTATFSEQYTVVYEVSGAGSVSDVLGGLSFANPDWSYSSWNYDTPITGDGRYASTILPGGTVCSFTGVNCLDLNGLCTAAPDASVKITGIYWK